MEQLQNTQLKIGPLKTVNAGRLIHSDIIQDIVKERKSRKTVKFKLIREKDN